MTTEEATIIVAEYMGWIYNGDNNPNRIFRHKESREEVDISYFKYATSLDSMIPVLEKLEEHIVIEMCRHGAKGYHSSYFRNVHNEKIDAIDEDVYGGKDIKVATLIAAARCIEEKRCS